MKNENPKKIILVPCGVREDKNYEVSCENRLEMLKLSIEDYFAEEELKKLEINDIEIKNGKMIPTYILMQTLQKEYEENLWFLIGSDVLQNLHKFYEFEKLKENVNFFIVKRFDYSIKGFEKNLPQNYVYHKNWKCSSKGVSSSEFKLIKEDSFEFFVTPKVLEYIRKSNLYNFKNFD